MLDVGKCKVEGRDERRGMSVILRKRRIDSDTAKRHLTANMTTVVCHSLYTRGLKTKVYDSIRRHLRALNGREGQ